MARERTVKWCRTWYGALLRFYPESYFARFGEPMEQTFGDLLRERRNANKGLFAFVLWIFIETSIGIIKENLSSNTMQKNILRLALGTAALLIIPVLGNAYVDGWNWTGSDFVFAGALIFGTGLAYLLISRQGNSMIYRTAVGIALAVIFMLVWVNGAVGIIGNENNPANLLYVGVILVEILGAILARLKPAGMSRVMYAAAAVQFLVPVFALFVWRPTLLEPPGIIGVFILNTFFVALLVLSGMLFKQSEQERRIA